MTIKNDPEELYREILAAERFRASRLDSFSKMVARYHGPGYRNDHPDEEWFPENQYYEMVALGVPQLVYDNPRVKVESRRPGAQKFVADALKMALNRWVRDVDLVGELQPVVTDMLFNWGVMRVVQEPTPDERAMHRWRILIDDDGRPIGQEKTDQKVSTRRPFAYRVSQRKFLLDPVARRVSEARFMGHEFIRSRRGIIREALEDPESGWDLDVLQAMEDGEAAGRYGASADEDSAQLEDRHENLDRDEIRGWEIWVPEITLEDSPGHAEGFNGTLFTITTWEDEEGSRKIEYLREPRPYYGPPWGPYTLFGVYNVPDEPLPLSPLVAIEANIVALNRRVLAVHRNDIEYKRLVLYDETDTDAAETLAETPDGYFAGIANLEATNVKEVQIGGSTPEQHQGIAIERERLDRNGGIHDAQRGSVTGVGTATENQIAAEGATARFGYLKKQVARATQNVLRTACWYLYHDDRVIFPVGMPGMPQGMPEPWFQGGTFEEGSGATFNDLDLDIEPYSMERADEGNQARKRIAGFQMIAEASQMIPAAPFIKWPLVFEHLGDALNWPDLGSLIDMQMLQQFLEQQGQQEGPNTYIPRPKASLSRDVGGGGGNWGSPKQSTSSQGSGGRSIGSLPAMAAGGGSGGAKPTALGAA